MLQNYDVTGRSPGEGRGKETACDWCGFYWHRESSSERNPQLKGMKFCLQFVYHWWEGVMWKHFRFSFLRVTGVPKKRKRYKEWTNWSWHPRYCPVECRRTLVFRGGEPNPCSLCRDSEHCIQWAGSQGDWFQYFV